MSDLDQAEKEFSELEFCKHKMYIGEMCGLCLGEKDKEIASLKEKVKELETVMGAWHNIFGTMQLSHAKDRLDFSEEKVKQLEAQIAVLHRGLEDIGKILDKGGWSRVAEMIVAQALSSSPSEFLEVVRKGVEALEFVSLNMIRTEDGELKARIVLKVGEALSKLRRFV